MNKITKKKNRLYYFVIVLLVFFIYTGGIGYLYILWEVHQKVYFEINDPALLKQIIDALCGDLSISSSFLKNYAADLVLYGKYVNPEYFRIVVVPKNLWQYYSTTYSFVITEYYPYYTKSKYNELFKQNLDSLMSTLFPYTEYLGSPQPTTYLEYQPRIRLCARRCVAASLSKYYYINGMVPSENFKVSLDLFVFVKHSWYYLRFLYLRRLYLFSSMTSEIKNWIA